MRALADRWSTIGQAQLEFVGIVTEPADVLGSPQVAVVNERFAVTCFYAVDAALGKHFFYYMDQAHAHPVEIVGVVADTRQSSLRDEPLMYHTPLAQQQDPPAWTSFAVLTAGDPKPLTAALREEIRAVHPGRIVCYVRMLDQQADDRLYRERLLTILSGLLAALALPLASV